MGFETGRLKKTLILINSVLLIIIILFSPLAYYIFNLNYYVNLYKDNKVFSVLNKNDVLDVTNRIYEFFKYGSDLNYPGSVIQVRYADESKSTVAEFGPDEISHLGDVRVLLVRVLILYYTCIVLFIIMTLLLIEKNIKSFMRSLGIIFIIPSALMMILITILYLLGKNFPVLFDNFHLLFFPQGNYAFPEGSLIITLFPFGFFYDFFIRLIKSSAIISAVLLVIGITFTNIFKIFKINNK